MAQPTATITMSMREADRLKTVEAVIDRMLPVGQAAQRLIISRRQLERLMQRYRSEGAGGLVSRKLGCPSNHQLAPGIAQRAMSLIKERYADFGPTLASEKLRECHRLPLAKETGQDVDDRSGPLDAAQPPGSADPPATQPARLPWSADPD